MDTHGTPFARTRRALLIRWWQFKRWWRGPWSSPLGLRRSLRMLRLTGSTHPYLDLFRLLWPLPWWFPCSLPDTPQFLQDNPELIHDRHVRHHKLRLMPLWRWRDTPQRSLYRLYECFIARQGTLVGYETEYFWRHREPTRWQPHLLEDPGEHGDPERRAVIAALIEDLVDSFNWRMGLGLRRCAPIVERARDGTPAPFTPYRCPEWVYTVGRLPETLLISEIDPYHEEVDDNDPWKRRNIVCGVRGDLRTV
ncbi:hypothetical protein GGR50DRAFT_425150 [Xylaria sp. CBS 124048]|nr:hypothetical protein GGR50DRAFT_425150 [Xylaria sp. CBS 124048]